MGAVSDLSQTLLAIAVGALTDPPARQVVVVGEAALDCEMVWVSHLSTIRRGTDSPTGARTDRCAILPVATFRVGVVRCWPTGDDRGNPADPTDVTATAWVMQDDGEALFNALFDERDQYPGTARLGPALPVQPSGLIAGYACDVEIDLATTPALGS